MMQTDNDILYTSLKNVVIWPLMVSRDVGSISSSVEIEGVCLTLGEYHMSCSLGKVLLRPYSKYQMLILGLELKSSEMF